MKAMDLLWGRDTRRTRGPRPVLTTTQIAGAGIEIADAEGLTAVTMQRVADRFGFTAMSLYRYVPGRAELISLMIDTAMGAAPVLDTTAGWRPALREWTYRLAEVSRQHPWLGQATLQSRPVGPRELGWMEQAVTALAGTGLSGARCVDAALLLSGHVRNQIQAESGIAADGGGELAAALAETLREHAADYPALIGAAADGAFGPDETGFDFGLTCILNGIAAAVPGE
ncbi:TetR family transcriptional regulator [Actinoplanes capillaceus]|uniref:TetR family transcriptional regulator n=1 Tax=Actinoplanes campanulatus TaxID=113559 RepID=A0ABQ3WJL6_9ACTN|nr:TetR/AcrR family transcriptional regulator C-terminal domain-containing protein [Actinoplanes capillaceus]GID46437.1 TetR family transcriptional regulator [Actinoplanes capillaceus]